MAGCASTVRAPSSTASGSLWTWTASADLLAECRTHGHLAERGLPRVPGAAVGGGGALPRRLHGGLRPARQRRLRRLAVLPGRGAAARAGRGAGEVSARPRRRGRLGPGHSPRPPLAGPRPPARAGPPPAPRALRLVGPAGRGPATVQGVRPRARPGARRRAARRDHPALQIRPGERPAAAARPLSGGPGGSARDAWPGGGSDGRAPFRWPAGRTGQGVGGLLREYGEIVRRGSGRRARGGGRHRQDAARRGVRGPRRARGRDRRRRAVLRGRDEPGLRAVRRGALRRDRPGGYRAVAGPSGWPTGRGGPPAARARRVAPRVRVLAAARHSGRQEPVLRRCRSGPSWRFSTVPRPASSSSTTCSGPTRPPWTCSPT